jgi:hypothetical protein
MAVIVELGSKVAREDRVRSNTDPAVNRRIDSELEQRIRYYSVQDPQVITERLDELDREWDIERILETNAAALTFGGLLLALARGRRWLALPLFVSGFLLNHAIQGWCPAAKFLRSRGVRTRLEIEQERYALKILRGDFDALEVISSEGARTADQIIQAIRL